jgi:hypothetical protein
MLFDAHNPDRESLQECLAAPERNDIRQSVAHATFSMRGNLDTNVCWLAGSEYDCLLAHFFRAILFHYLSFMKVYTTEQKYYVRQNLSLRTYTHISGVQYRKVMFSFGLGARPLNHEDSSDYEATEEGLNQEEEEEEGKDEGEGKEEKKVESDQ